MVRLICALIVLIVAGSGCARGHVGGVSLAAGSHERGLWFDHDRRQYQPAGVGVKFDLVAGYVIRPVPRFWVKGENPWQGGSPWFVIRVPFAGPFVSVAIGERGVYCGFKTFVVEARHGADDRYGRWIRPEELPADEGGSMVYLTPSATIRRTRDR